MNKTHSFKYLQDVFGSRRLTSLEGTRKLQGPFEPNCYQNLESTLIRFLLLFVFFAEPQLSGKFLCVSLDCF